MGIRIRNTELVLQTVHTELLIHIYMQHQEWPLPSNCLYLWHCVHFGFASYWFFIFYIWPAGLDHQVYNVLQQPVWSLWSRPPHPAPPPPPRPTQTAVMMSVKTQTSLIWTVMSLVDLEQLWRTRTSCGGPEATVEDQDQLWRTKNSCGGPRAAVEDPEQLWRTRTSCGGPGPGLCNVLCENHLITVSDVLLFSHFIIISYHIILSSPGPGPGPKVLDLDWGF